MSDEPHLLPGAPGPGFFEPGNARDFLEQTVLPAYLPGCRWFGGKARDPQRFAIRQLVALSTAPAAARLVLIEVHYATGTPETYLLPLQIAAAAQASRLRNDAPHAIVARFADGSILFDAVHDAAFRADLFTLIAGSDTISNADAELRGLAGEALPQEVPESRVLAVEQSNSSLIYGERVFLKLYRRLEEGVNPDAEILRFLGAARFAHVPAFCGALELHHRGLTQVLALATAMVPNEGDAWAFALSELRRQLEAVQAARSAEAAKIETDCLARAAQLGRHTGALHRALAAETSDPEFAPEPLTAQDFAALAETVRTTADLVLTSLGARLETLDPPTRKVADSILAAEPMLRQRIAALAAEPVRAAKTRTHGDYHLGQVLNTGSDFIIIDFEGEPAKSLAERRRKRSPIRDVAGMLRSFHYAAHSVLNEFSEDRSLLESAAEHWHERAGHAFLQAWLDETSGAPFRPAARADFARLLDAFLLEKALYEVVYELNNRPTWLSIPLRGVQRVLHPA